MNKKKNTERGPFDDPVRLATDRVLSLVALAVGAAALALHTGPVVIGAGVLALLMGLLGLTFGNW
ncbi:MAG: hypothetical protein LUG64_06170 [Clostridiales bacterium]|nr:hypothetical protein [Clostridiales bacterium]